MSISKNPSKSIGNNTEVLMADSEKDWITRIKENEELGLKNIINTLWRRKLLILGVTVFLNILVTLVLFQIEPRYQASSQVMIESRQSKVADVESVISGLSPEMAAIISEVEILKSGALLGRLVDKIGLEGDPEFNSDLRPPPFWKNWFNPVQLLLRDVREFLGMPHSREDLSEEELIAETRARVIGQLRTKLSIAPVRRSLVINITVTSTDKKKAVKIANTLSDLYIVDQLEAKFEATKRATGWLSDRLNTLKTNVETAERSVQTFRMSVASKIGQRSRITAQQISGLNNQLILAQTKRAEAGARLKQVEALLLAGSEDIATSAEVLNSMLIQRLRSQEAEVIRKVSELDSRYGPRHPKMRKARNELKDLRSSIQKEVEKIAQSLRNEMGIAKAREATLQKNLDKLEGKNNDQNKAAIKLRELEREAKASQVLYANFLNRFKETSTQEGLQQADSRIISRATIPSSPSYPKKQLIIVVSTLVGVLLGVVLSLLLDLIAVGFQNTRELEEELGVSFLGITPVLRRGMRPQAVANWPLEKKTSSAAESIRNIQTAIRLTDVDNPPKVLSILSTVPSEGKSTLALWIGQMEAMAGKKVLVIDCDLRRPSLHTRLNLPNDSHLVSVVSNECSLEEAIVELPKTGLRVLVGTHLEGTALDVISSKRIEDIIEEAREKFDLVILDSPPILAVAEARVISRLSDKVIYAVRWNKTPKELVKTGLRVIHQSKASLAGVVLSLTDSNKTSQYGHYDYGYYYGKYKSYYTD